MSLRMIATGRRIRHRADLPPWLKEAPRPTGKPVKLVIPDPTTTIALGELAGLVACAFTFGTLVGWCACLSGFFGGPVR